MNTYHGSWPIKVCDVTWRHAIKGWDADMMLIIPGRLI